MEATTSTVVSAIVREMVSTYSSSIFNLKNESYISNSSLDSVRYSTFLYFFKLLTLFLYNPLKDDSQ